MRNPDRERFMRAVKHVEQEEIPLFEMEADPAIVRQMLGKSVDMALHSFELPIEDVVEWNRQMGNDMVYFAHVWHLGRNEKVDEDGRLHYIDGTIKSRDDFDRITFPDLDDHRRRLDALCEAIDGTGFGLVHGAQTAGFTVPTAIGYEDFCLATVMDPDFVLDFQKRIHEYCLQELEMVLQYPVDAIKIASGMITNTGSMISPAMMEEFEYCWMKELAGFVKERGRHVLFHIDGDVSALVPRFLEMGADILNPIQPSVGALDIYALKERHGDALTLCGNIDVDGVLMKGTPEEVAADVHQHIERLAGDGGYIVASSHDLHQLLPVENIHAMRDAVHRYQWPAKKLKYISGEILA